MVGDDTGLQRMHSHHITGGSAQHIPCGSAYLEDLAGVFVHGNHRGLPNDDTLAVHIDKYIGGTQIDTQIVRE